MIVESGAVPALVPHLQVSQSQEDDVTGPMLYEHEVEKRSAFTLGLLAIKVPTLYIFKCITSPIDTKEYLKDGDSI